VDVSDRNKALARRWFEEVWNQESDAAIDELFPHDGVAHGLGDTDADVRGPAEFRSFAANIRGSLSGLRVAIEDIFGEGERVAIRIRLQGVHSGAGLGVAPTGRRVVIQGIVIMRMENGRIVEAWNSYDQLGLLNQIGAIPGSDAGDRFLGAR
jgi:steroid delta-isomerase-like uncharacterized protein